MVKVIANEKGYYGGAIRDAGESFNLDDEIWKDEKRRPKWVRLSRRGLAEMAESLASEPAGEEKPADEPKAQDAPKAPKQEPKGNGVKEALGTAPDWLPPEGVPKAVTA